MMTMAHLTEAQLHEYLDGELQPATKARADAHLEGCGACHARLAELESLFADLAQAPDRPLERDLAKAVVATLKARRSESRLIARLAGAQVALGAFVASVGLLLMGGMRLPTGMERDILAWIDGWMVEAQAIEQTVADALAELYGALLRFSAPWPLAPPADLESWLFWAPGLGLALVIWLVGNGVLLRERGRWRSN